MQRRLIAIAVLAAGGAAHGQPAQPDPDAPASGPRSPGAASEPGSPGAQSPDPTDPASAGTAPETTPMPAAEPPEADEIGDQLITAEIGLASGGRVTPGGLQITGRYFYQLSARDWFEGAVAFTFGSGEAACFRDRQDELICRHGLADGAGVEIAAGVRRLFEPQGAFRPFVRVGAGLGVARFADDDVTGATFRLHGGGGLRVAVAPAIAVVASGDLGLGFGRFGRGLGNQPVAGFAITAGVEFRLQ